MILSLRFISFLGHSLSRFVFICIISFRLFAKFFITIFIGLPGLDGRPGPEGRKGKIIVIYLKVKHVINFYEKVIVDSLELREILGEFLA